MRRRTSPSWFLAAAFVFSSCASWTPVERFRGWTLYGENGHDVPATSYAAAFEPAFEAVEEALGPFRGAVRVHALEASDDEDLRQDTDLVHDIPGIGRARVRAYHARGGGVFGPPAGIYSSMPDAGTAAHELVHARLAEEMPNLPLWFEEGLACFLGDGFLDGDRWVVDGLSYWPLRELRDQHIDDRQLARLLTLRAEDDDDVRENVLVHFVGWAIVFDLYRESRGFDWRGWARSNALTMSVGEARRRMRRTLAPETEEYWFMRLSDEDPAVRIAAAKGAWKLRSEDTVARLLDALDVEEDPEARVALAINVLAAAGELRLSGPFSGRMWRATWPVMKRGKLDDPLENSALQNLYRSFRWKGGVDSHQALEGLRRFWAE